MNDILHNMQWWHWWIVAAVLAAVETFIPGVLAIWFAASAAVVGALLLAFPMPWQLQLVLFGVLGTAMLLVWRRYRRAEDLQTDQPGLNQRGQRYVGQTFTLIDPIQGGHGKVEVGDTVWLVQGSDAPAGARVRVVGVSGTVLQVTMA